MNNPLSQKLSRFVDLDASERAMLDTFCRTTQSLASGTTLIEEGDRPDDVVFLVEGWGYRFKILPTGERQIMAYLVPGDLCDVHIFILQEMDHSIGLLSDARVARIPKADMLQAFHEHPRIAQALWWATLVDEAVLREWLVNIGQRSAFESIAHLFCELWLRLSEVGLTKGYTFALPFTQEQLGDTMGLTPVHVNRTLQRMREEGLITLKSKELVIEDIERLRQIADFNPNYLHLDRRH
ncbi:MAG: Crp/Fnr family transcriptional regulator [Erythrobacter sp.]|nr:Crp/Fnr family transcriptional regulator [Erythrobacter sp.]